MAASNKDAVMPFGKHKGKLVSDVYEEDLKYLKWLIENVNLTGELKQAVEYHVDL